MLLGAKHFNTPPKQIGKHYRPINKHVFGVIYNGKYKVGYYINSDNKPSIVFGKEWSGENTGVSLSVVTGYKKLPVVAPTVFIKTNHIRLDFFPTIMRDTKLRLGMSLSVVF
jgi:hypothetical protein